MKIQKIFLAATFLFFVFYVNAFAAKLSVTVLVKGSGDPVEGATVVLGETGEYDVTNAKGIIIFEDIEAINKIKILNPGFETLEASIPENETEISLYLFPITVEGEALEVVEERLPEKVSKIILVQEESRRIPGTAGDPVKALSTLPGIVVASGQGGPGAVYVRGSGQDDNAAIINRIPVEYLYHFGDLSGISPSVVNPNLVKDFNAFLGGFPVEYDDKLGGILDVQLRNPKNDRLHQTYRLAIHEAAFLVEGPVQEENDNDSFYVAGRMSYLDRILTPKIINKLINSGADEEDKDDFTIVTLPKYYDAQANWHRDLNKGYFDAYFFTAGDSVSVNISEKAVKNRDPAVAGTLSIDLSYYSVGANWLHRFNNSLTGIGTWTYRQSNAKQIIGTDPVTKENFFVKTDTKFATFDPQLIWRAHPKHEITAGSNFTRNWTPIDLYITVLPSEDNVNYNFTTSEKYRFDTTLHAGMITPYVKHRWQITDKLTSSLGLRYSYIKASGGIEMSGYSPRGTMDYQIHKQVLLSASWGKYLQFPNGATIISGIGNPTMGFTEAEHRILSAEYKPTSLWSIKLEGYHKPMEKLVLFIPEQRAPNNYDNIGEGEAYGLDLLIKREFRNRTMGWLSYSYSKSSRTTVKGDDRNFASDQPHTLNFVWSQPMTGGWKRWTWGVKLTMHSGATYTPVVGRLAYCGIGTDLSPCLSQSQGTSNQDFSHYEAINAKQNSERLPFYYLMSVRFDREIRFNTWKMNLFMDIQNLSFRKNVIGYDYGKQYEKINNPTEIAAFYFPLPLFGVEAEF